MSEMEKTWMEACGRGFVLTLLPAVLTALPLTDWFPLGFLYLFLLLLPLLLPMLLPAGLAMVLPGEWVAVMDRIPSAWITGFMAAYCFLFWWLVFTVAFSPFVKARRINAAAARALGIGS